MSKEKSLYKIYLDETEIPKAWYNLRADMKTSGPLLNPGTLEPMTAAELSGVFCDELVRRSLTTPLPISKFPKRYAVFIRCTVRLPLVRAYCLEEKLGTPAKIYYKFEGNNTSGSHKLNSAVAQAYYAKKQGLKGVTTETESVSGNRSFHGLFLFRLDCKVYMVKVSYEQKPFRREVMRVYGAWLLPPPPPKRPGRKILEEHPEPPAVSAAPFPRRLKWPRRARAIAMFSAACSTRFCCISRL